MMRQDMETFKRRVRENVEQSKRDIPAGFVMPTTAQHTPPPKQEQDDDDFWNDSEESDFGGDSDEDMTFGEQSWGLLAEGCWETNGISR